MSRLSSACLAVLCTLCFAGTASAESSWHTYSNSGGSRRYLLEVPAKTVKRPPPVVYRLGCSQSAADVAQGTGWSRLAREKGFVVVYPEQPDGGCWDWPHTANQHRGAGEPALIAGITA